MAAGKTPFQIGSWLFELYNGSGRHMSSFKLEDRSLRL
jgi:hypothetical protein